VHGGAPPWDHHDALQATWRGRRRCEPPWTGGRGAFGHGRFCAACSRVRRNEMGTRGPVSSGCSARLRRGQAVCGGSATWRPQLAGGCGSGSDGPAFGGAGPARGRVTGGGAGCTTGGTDRAAEHGRRWLAIEATRLSGRAPPSCWGLFPRLGLSPAEGIEGRRASYSSPPWPAGTRFRRCGAGP